MLVEKEVIRPGTYWYRDEVTGEPRKLEATPELIRYWHEQGSKMLSAGLPIPVPYEHDFQAHPMTPKEKLLNNAGQVKQYQMKGDQLWSVVDVSDPDVKRKIGKSIRWTSPWISSFTDGSGNKWNNVIAHLALTTRPRITQQQPFSSIAAALSLATNGEPNQKAGYCLSRAGLLDGKGQPVYPMAFSLWGGIGLATDASGHEHDASGKFGGEHHANAKASSVKASTAARDTGHSGARVASFEADAATHSASDRASHDEAADKHYAAYKQHTEQSKIHKAAGNHAEAAKHSTIAGHHMDTMLHHTKAASMAFSVSLAAGDAPPKKKPPLSQGGAPDANPTPGETDDEDADGVSDDLDPDNPEADADDSGVPDILEDPNSDIGMEELLCDLLQALGVPMPDESNEQEFKRHLYEAVMSKIKELTSEGMGQAKKDKFQPDQNRPPTQQPNASQPNPLIQQESQPMFMSLEDINKISDPTMKSIALAMHAENAKMRAELDASQKTSNSLASAKLTEATAKRAERVAWLGRISPKAKSNLDAMLALPHMALSLGDKGEIIDPMAQTLEVLEVGLGDLPKLFTTDAAALSQQAQPRDETMLSEQRTNEVADVYARAMGCPPAKAG